MESCKFIHLVQVKNSLLLRLCVITWTYFQLSAGEAFYIHVHILPYGYAPHVKPFAWFTDRENQVVKTVSPENPDNRYRNYWLWRTKWSFLRLQACQIIMSKEVRCWI